jgi:MOSC domain-containing protein YiiM
MPEKTPARLASIQVGTPREHGGASAAGGKDRTWTTAFYKSAVVGPVVVRRTYLDGDALADLVHLGGPDKAVCVYAVDHYAYWQVVFGAADVDGLHLSGKIPPGGFGENFSVAGLTEADVCVGDTWQIGDAVFQVSQPRQPCWKLARRWGIKTLAAQVIETGKTGWYFRVLEEGTVAAGMTMTFVERPCPEWTVERANQVMHHDKHNHEAARALANVPQLSESWQAELRKRFQNG